MVTFAAARKLALSMDGAVERPHFDRTSFRTPKRIFATFWEKEGWMMVKLPLPEQKRLCAELPGVVWPVPNKWGEGGATLVDLAKVSPSRLKEAVFLAWRAASEPVAKSSRKRSGS